MDPNDDFFDDDKAANTVDSTEVSTSTNHDSTTSNEITTEASTLPSAADETDHTNDKSEDRPESASNSPSQHSATSMKDSPCHTDDGGDSIADEQRSAAPSNHRGRQRSQGDEGVKELGGRANKPETRSKGGSNQNQRRQQRPTQQVQQQQSAPRDNGARQSRNSNCSSSGGSASGGCTPVPVMKSRNSSQGSTVAAASSDATGRDRSQRTTTSPATNSKSVSIRDSYEFDERSAGTSAAPFGRVEPKFEPRFSHYKTNTVEGVKWDTTYFVEHRKRIAGAKPLVDNKPPPNFSHIHSNMKKLKMMQDRQNEIEKDNKLLLGRLVKAMTTTRIDNWNDVDHHHTYCHVNTSLDQRCM